MFSHLQTDTTGIKEYIARVKSETAKNSDEEVFNLHKLKHFQINDDNYHSQIDGPIAEGLLFISRLIGYFVS